MGRELFERDKRTLKGNLRECTEQMSKTAELGKYHMDEIAYLAIYGCDTEEQFLAAYSDIKEGLGLEGAAGAPLLACLCRSICAHAEKRGRKLSFSDFFDAEPSSDAQVTYVKNAISDEAYRVFSEVLENASVTYAPSFVTACENVYYGRVQYCILPQENSDEGNLSGFMRLARKYELYPHYICTVRGESSATKLALLGREPCAAALGEQKGLRLRVSLYSPSCKSLAAVACAAGELGLTLVKTESAPLEWDGQRYAQSFVFSADGADVVPFLIYLALEVSDCSDKSVYYEL